MFAIEKNIPIPEAATVANGSDKYQFSRMEVGDSIFVPCAEGETPAEVRKKLFNAARRYGRLNNKKFTVLPIEAVMEDGLIMSYPGARCWLVSEDRVPA